MIFLLSPSGPSNLLEWYLAFLPVSIHISNSSYFWNFWKKSIPMLKSWPRWKPWISSLVWHHSIWEVSGKSLGGPHYGVQFKESIIVTFFLFFGLTGESSMELSGSKKKLMEQSGNWWKILNNERTFKEGQQVLSLFKTIFYWYSRLQYLSHMRKIITISSTY